MEELNSEIVEKLKGVHQKMLGYKKKQFLEKIIEKVPGLIIDVLDSRHGGHCIIGEIPWDDVKEDYGVKLSARSADRESILKENILIEDSISHSIVSHLRAASFEVYLVKTQAGKIEQVKICINIDKFRFSMP